MRTYQVCNVQTVAYSYTVNAESENEAESKLEDWLCGDKTITGVQGDENDKTIENYYQCEGEI